MPLLARSHTMAQGAGLRETNNILPGSQALQPLSGYTESVSTGRLDAFDL